MALSNWDLLAINEGGKSTGGQYAFIPDEKKHLSIELYKNWAYLHDAEAWNKDTADFTESIVMQISSGNFGYKGIQIAAKRGKQNSLYLYSERGGYSDEPKQIFAGIAAYGYKTFAKELFKRIGKKYTAKHEDVDWSTMSNGKDDFLCKWDDAAGKAEDILVPKDFELTRYVGVMQTTVNDFKKWMEELCKGYEYGASPSKEWIESVEWNNLVRYNMGDAFFSNAAGDGLPGTQVGKQEDETALSQIIGEIFKPSTKKE